MAFANVNFLSIFVSAIAAWLVGAAYYGLLGKVWIAAQSAPADDVKARHAVLKGTVHAWLPFVLSFVAELIVAYVLYGLMRHIGAMTLRGGIISGAFVWFGFVLTIMLVNNAFSGRKYALTIIDGGHWLIVLLVIGAILGAWGG